MTFFHKFEKFLIVIASLPLATSIAFIIVLSIFGIDGAKDKYEIFVLGMIAFMITALELIGLVIYFLRKCYQRVIEAAS